MSATKGVGGGGGLLRRSDAYLAISRSILTSPWPRSCDLVISITAEGYGHAGHPSHSVAGSHDSQTGHVRHRGHS